MTLYTRPQLALLLLLVGAGGLGLGVGHWRRAHPELVERIEGFDRGPDAASETASTETGPNAPGHSAARHRLLRRAIAPPPTEAPAEPVDVNRASADDLVRLPGIGPTLAARIVAARELEGPFASVDDLRRVRGLGAAKIDRFRPLVTVARSR